MTFVDDHPLRAVFVASLMERLVNQIVEQGDDLLHDAGLAFPSRAVSTMLLLGETGGASAADIARELGQPHQLVTQRVELLIGLGVITRTDDSSDARRKLLKLTPQGRQQFQRLKKRLALADKAITSFFEDIDCDLSAAASRAMDALSRSSLLERVHAFEEAAT